MFPLIALLSCCQSFFCVYFVTGFCSHSLPCCPTVNRASVFISLLGFVPTHYRVVLLSIVLLCLFRYWVLFPLIALLSCCQSFFCVYFVTGFCSRSLPCCPAVSRFPVYFVVGSCSHSLPYCPAVNHSSVFISLLGFVPVKARSLRNPNL